MTLGLHESRLRRRRRARWTIAKWIMTLIGVVAAGVFAYETGSTLAQRDVEVLGEKIEDLTAKVREVEAESAQRHARLVAAENERQAAVARYEKDVPSGDLADLLGRVRDKLDDGVAPDRLAFLIDSARNARVCDETPETKRFIVQTPLTTGANDSVGFAKGAITVTAVGDTSTTADGKILARFDPAKPITLRLTEIGGQTSEHSGKLPLHASVVMGANEHRFTVVAGPPGFVKVTGDRCDYP